MLTIIEIQARPDGGHNMESQSHRTENWMGEGWVEVPPQLEQAAWSCCGYCQLVMEDGKLTDLIPGEIPAPPEAPATDTQVLNALLGVSGNE